MQKKRSVSTYFKIGDKFLEEVSVVSSGWPSIRCFACDNYPYSTTCWNSLLSVQLIFPISLAEYKFYGSCYLLGTQKPDRDRRLLDVIHVFRCPHCFALDAFPIDIYSEEERQLTFVNMRKV